jgi:hypothetical protein
MSVGKAYMGRIFLSPPSTGAEEIWINFGWHTIGAQKFPEWIEELEPICNQDDYNSLISELKTYLEKNGMNVYFTEFATICFCLIFPLISTCYKARQIQQDVNEIVNQHKIQFKLKNMRCCVIKQAALISKSEKVYDQFGCILATTATGQGTKPIWPPLGYNLIFHLAEGVSVRNNWPPKQSPLGENVVTAVPNK